MEDLWQALVQHLIDFGPAGLFLAMIIEGLGIPFPGDATLALYGFLASRESMPLWHLSLAGTAGCLTGSFLAFLTGRALGPAIWKWLFALRLAEPERLEKANAVMERYGPWILVFGRFIPGLRALSSYLAGMSGIRWWEYLWWSWLGFASWVGCWVLIGFQLGENWEAAISAFQQYVAWILAAIAGAALVWWWRKRA